MDATEEAWKSARILNGWPDSPEMRRAFYAGARYGMNAMIDADTDEAHALNDSLLAFARSKPEVAA